MQKTDLIKAVAEKTGMTQVTTGKVINAVIDLITDTLKKGDEKITLTGFGTFEVRTKKERMGTNPSTREKIKIPAGKSVKFSAGASLKAVVSGKPDAKKAGAKKAPKKGGKK